MSLVVCVYAHTHACMHVPYCIKQFVLQPPSHVRLSSTPWAAARQASLSLTISKSLPKLMSTELVIKSFIVTQITTEILTGHSINRNSNFFPLHPIGLFVCSLGA